jgi:hypothetical protein
MNDDTRDRIMEKALSGRMGRLIGNGNDDHCSHWRNY